MTEFNLANCKYDFASDKIDIIVLLYDVSGSMKRYAQDMRKANKAFFDDFSRFEDKSSIAISKAVFNNYFKMSNFESIEGFDTSYYPDGGTELFAAIERTVDNIMYYFNEVQSKLNVRPKITFLVFTDGEDNCGSTYSYTAHKAVLQLNEMEATTVFVAFGDAVGTKMGEKLGFSCTKDIKSVKELVATLGTQLSQSCKLQSQSAYSLKSSFFSQAAGNAEEDAQEEQPITDDDFFNVNL